MADHVPPRPRPAAPWLAFFVSGAGHFALGRWARGLAWNLGDSVILFGLVESVLRGALKLWFLLIPLVLLARIAVVVDVVRLRRDATDVPGWGRAALLILALVVVGQLEARWVRATRLEAFSIPSGSSIPTLLVGDHIFVDKSPFTPSRGQTIVFPYPRDPEKDFVKRVIAIGGDTVRVDDGVPVVNGQPVLRRPLGDCHYDDYDDVSGQRAARTCLAFEETLDGNTFTAVQDAGFVSRPFGEVKVPPGQLFVLGDNRDNSSDSRVWGFVPVETVKGRVLSVYWSSGPDGVRWDRVGETVH